MSQITPDLLKALAPQTEKKLRDRFLPDLNLILPAYGIINELEVSAFLATACFESAYFRTMHEYGKGKGRKYGNPDPITGLIYYGRGIFQNTWKKGYQAFTNYVAKNWDKIKHRAPTSTPPNFVLEPDLLATTFWAVEAACWYWQENGLAKYAQMGVKGYFALQGLVNRGSATKKALDYDDRLKIYEALRRVMPDDFKLDSAVRQSSDEQGAVQPSASDPSGNAAEILKLGSRGEKVEELQSLLNIESTGNFLLITEEAVKDFQADHGLEVDGIVGPKTWAALHSASEHGGDVRVISDTDQSSDQSQKSDADSQSELRGDGSGQSLPVIRGGEQQSEGSTGKEEPPAPPPVEVKAATMSWEARITAIGAFLTSLGISIKDGLSNPYTIAVVGAFAVIGYLIYRHEMKARDARTNMYFENAQRRDTPDILVT